MAPDESGGVTIGNVSGGIHGSIIAGRDVSNATITLGGQPVAANKQPTPDELKQLLAEIQQELAKVMAQKDALQQVDVAAPNDAQGVEARVNDAVAKVEGEVSKEQTESVQKNLAKATGVLGEILDGAKTVAEKAGEVGQAVKPLADTLVPLVEKLGVAALWVGKLWLMG
jgi:phage-related tail protein